METVLLENCIKQYQILLTSLKEYLISIYKNNFDYDETKRNLYTVIQMVNTAEEVMKIYNNEDK